MIKLLNLKLVIQLEHPVIKIRYTPNWSEEAFVIKKVKNTVPSIYAINDLNGKEIVGNFYENKLKQKHIKKNLKLQK